MSQSGFVSPGEASREVVTLGHLREALRRKSRMIFGVSFAVFVLALVFVMIVTPRFAGEAEILLESREGGYTRTLTERELQVGVFDEQAVASQVQVISSRDVAREAIRRLGLVGNPEFDPLAGPVNPVTRIQMMLGASRGLYDGAEEDRIFENYYSRLTVFSVARSRVVAIRFDSEDPELAARAANTIAEVYLEQLEDAKSDLARAASSWLGTSIEDLRERVTAAEESVEAFRSRSGLFVGGNNATITSQQLSDINTELAQARSAQADAQARARLITDMIASGRAFEIPDVANNEMIVRLIEQRVAMRSQLALEQQTLLPGHPRIRELRAQASDLDVQITSAAERTVRILENDARLAGARVESLEAALDAQMRVVTQANESEVRLRALEREARAEREQLEAYLTRYREAVARGSGNAFLPDGRIVSRAVVPQEPVFPQKVPTVLLATLAALFFTVGGVVASELAFGDTRAGVQARYPRQSAAFHSSAPPTEPPRPAPASSTESSRPKGRLGRWFSRSRDEKPAAAAAFLPEPEQPAAYDELSPRAAFDEPVLRGTLEAESDIPVNEEHDPEAFARTEEEAFDEMEYAEAPDPTGVELAEPVMSPDAAVAPATHSIKAAEAAEEDEARTFAAANHPGVKEEGLAAASASRDVIKQPAPPIAPPTITGQVIPTAASDTLGRAVATPVKHAVEGGKHAVEGGKREPATSGKVDAKKAKAGRTDEKFHFERLVERLSAVPLEGRGRRVLITGIGSPSRLATLARELSRELARTSNAIIIDMQRYEESDDAVGLTDLIADEASFFSVIQRDDQSRLHCVSIGQADPAILLQESRALEISLSAFDQTYEWVILCLPDVGEAGLLELLSKASDSVVLASDDDPSSARVLSVYDSARKAGAKQVLVACVGDLADAVAA